MLFFENIKHLDSNLLVVLGILLVLAIGITFFSIWDAYKRDFATSNEKLAWLQLSILVPFFGGLAYIIFGRKRGRKQ